MLSDEEKKAIEIVEDIAFIRGIRQDVDGELEDLKAIEDVLRLVEKQQKEIEELKQDRYKYEDWVMRTHINKDKIKAKIEPKLKELDEQINEEWKKYGNSKELQDMEDMYNFLQSLLEKE